MVSRETQAQAMCVLRGHRNIAEVSCKLQRHAKQSRQEVAALGRKEQGRERERRETVAEHAKGKSHTSITETETQL